MHGSCEQIWALHGARHAIGSCKISILKWYSYTSRIWVNQGQNRSLFKHLLKKFVEMKRCINKPLHGVGMQVYVPMWSLEWWNLICKSVGINPHITYVRLYKPSVAKSYAHWWGK